VVVIGIGNILCSDEGVGVHVVNELKRMKLPSNVKVFDCGTNGMAVLEAMDGAEKAIIIDAVSSEKEPGTIYFFMIEDLAKMEDRLLKLVSLHQFDLIATLKLAELTGAYRMPHKVVIIGVEVKSLKCSLELSDEVKRAVPKVIEAIIREIEKP
jgi:hydrogenase maturation protease